MKTLHLAEAGALLRYHDLPGTAPPLLFVHGLGCASSSDSSASASISATTLRAWSSTA